MMMTQSWRHPRLMPIGMIVGALSFTGCVRLEFDRMAGTRYPPTVIEDGEPVDLTTIFSDATAGSERPIALQVDEDETSIDPMGDDCLTDAELDALVEGRRDSEVGPTEREVRDVEFVEYNLYGVVVDHFMARDDGTCRPTILGKMYDYRPSGNRSGFVMYHEHPTVKTNDAKYLRSAAHEVGHAFNLHHQDGDREATLMNQTWLVGDDFDYEFSDDALTHLEEHPIDCVFPGTGPFYGVSRQHAGWHGGTFSCGR